MNRNWRLYIAMFLSLTAGAICATALAGNKGGSLGGGYRPFPGSMSSRPAGPAT